MSADRDDLINPERRLPDLALPSVPDGQPVPVRASGRRAPVLVLVHGGGCAPCGEFIHRLEEARQELEDWDGRVLVIVPEAAETAPGGGAFPVLADAEQRVAAAFGTQPPAVVIADQWGQVQEVHEAGEGHRFVEVREIVGTVRHLAIQCPECQGEAF